MASRSVVTRSRLPSITCHDHGLQNNNVFSKANIQRCASTEAMVKPRRRLKFDPTEPLTFRESLRIERQREERKKREREAVSADYDSDIDVLVRGTQTDYMGALL